MWISSSRSSSFPFLLFLELSYVRIFARRSLFFLITSYISPPIKVCTSSILISPRILFSPMIISSIIYWFFFDLIMYSDPITSPLDLITAPVDYLVINYWFIENIQRLEYFLQLPHEYWWPSIPSCRLLHLSLSLLYPCNQLSLLARLWLVIQIWDHWKMPWHAYF